MGVGNLAPTGIRSPDRPARSESLDRLRYPCPNNVMVLFSISSQQFFQVAANDCTAGIAATHHVLAHAFEDSWAVPNTFTC